MRESLHDFCIREGRQGLLDQWVEASNLPFAATAISLGGKRKVWWHSWPMLSRAKEKMEAVI